MRTPTQPRNRFSLAALAVASLLVLAACSSAATAATAGPAGLTSSDSAAGGMGAFGGPVDQAGAPSIAAPAPDQPTASGVPGQAPDPGTAGTPETDIVRTGSVSIEVPKIDPALDAVRSAITGLGGYVSDSDQSNSADQASASVTYRVPVARWQDALDAVQKIATKVDSAKSNAVEVTGQVLDLGARIDNLQTTERALQTIMGQATKIADILAVEGQLSDVQGQIEQLSTQQAHLKDQAALATLSVSFALPPTEAVVQTSRGWDPGAQLDQASAALLGMGQAVASTGIWLIVVGIPVALVILIVGGLAWFVARRIRRAAPAVPLDSPPALPPAAS
ncbi:MAG TPA: DUF4349 domain-containing protein [Candidatus Limnocylindrales bacterium]